MTEKAVHNSIGDFFFDEPDFDDCGGRTFRRVKVPTAVVRMICIAAVAVHKERLEANGFAVVPMGSIDEWFASEMKEYPDTEYCRYLKIVRRDMRAMIAAAEGEG